MKMMRKEKYQATKTEMVTIRWWWNQSPYRNNMKEATIKVQAISAMSGPTAMVVNNQIQALHSAAVKFFNFSSASRCNFSNFSIVNVFNGKRTGLQNCQCESGKEVLIRPGWLWIKVSSLGRSEFPLFKSPGVDDDSTLIISSIRWQSNPKHFEPLNLDYDSKVRTPETSPKFDQFTRATE